MKHIPAVALVAAAALVPGSSASPEPVAKIETGVGPCGAVSAYGAIWVVNYRGTELVRVDPATNRVTGRVRVRFGSCGVVGAYRSLWVDGYESSTFERVDPRRLRVIRRIRTGEKPW